MARGQVVSIDAARISDDATFHEVFAEALGFPAWYGRNFDAWIDLMTHLDQDHATTGLYVPEGDVVTLQIEKVEGFRTRLPELYATLIDSAAFVNWRRLDVGETAYLCLSFHR